MKEGEQGSLKGDLTALRRDGRDRLPVVRERLKAAMNVSDWWPSIDPFEICVGALLAQSTTWRNVEKAIENLRAEDALSVRALHMMHIQEIERLIRPSGFYRQKARRLVNFVSFLVERCEGDPLFLRYMSADEARSQLLRINGVGEETADTILLYACHLPAFVVDAYTRRLLHRLGIITGKETYGEIREMLEASIERDSATYAELHAMIVEFSKSTCRKEPLCDSCILADVCDFARHSEIGRYAAKKKGQQ